MEELGEHSDEEFIGIVEESDVEEDEDTTGLKENYNSLFEKSGEYAKVAKTAVKKMKKAEEEYRSLLVRYKEAKRVLNKPRNQFVVRFEARAKSLPRSQRGSKTDHVCHHYGLQGHTRPNCNKLRALRNASDQRSRRPRNDKRT